LYDKASSAKIIKNQRHQRAIEKASSAKIIKNQRHQRAITAQFRRKK